MNPVCFWQCFSVVGHLPGFHIVSDDIVPPFVCGCVPESPLYRFGFLPSGTFNNMTHGGRVITHAITSVLNSVNFPVADFLSVRHAFYNVVMFPDAGLLAELDEFAPLLTNYEANRVVVESTNLAGARFAILTMPLYCFSMRNQSVAIEMVCNSSKQSDFDAFIKLSGNKTQYDKCPLAVWFWMSRHHFNAQLVGTALDICRDFMEFSAARDGIQWLFMKGCSFWREIIAFLPSGECQHLLERVKSICPAGLEFTPDANVLAELFPNELRLPEREMRHRLYRYFTAHPGATLDDFKSYGAAQK
jgi:hypothetical protein